MNAPLTPDSPAGPDDHRSNASIYIAYHDARPVLSGRHLIPIQVGRAVSGLTLADMLGDDTGDNISALNPEYCELTAHYWAWKNHTAPGAVGLMHYRRLFDLSGRQAPRRYPERFQIGFHGPSYLQEVARHFTSTTSPTGQIILPLPIRLRWSVLEQYRRCHRLADLLTMRDVVAERHPGFLPSLDRTLQGNRLLLGNMFVMTRPVFDDYSRLLFDILDEARSRLAAAPTAQTAYQARYPGFLAERILTAYFLGGYAQAAFPDLRPDHRGIMNIDVKLPKQVSLWRLARFYTQGRISAHDALRLRLRADQS